MYVMSKVVLKETTVVVLFFQFRIIQDDKVQLHMASCSVMLSSNMRFEYRYVIRKDGNDIVEFYGSGTRKLSNSNAKGTHFFSSQHFHCYLPLRSRRKSYAVEGCVVLKRS